MLVSWHQHFLALKNIFNCLFLLSGSIFGTGFQLKNTPMFHFQGFQPLSCLRSLSKLQTPFTTWTEQNFSQKNSAMARLRDILGGWGPADPQNILKRPGFPQGALNPPGRSESQVFSLFLRTAYILLPGFSLWVTQILAQNFWRCVQSRKDRITHWCLNLIQYTKGKSSVNFHNLQFAWNAPERPCFGTLF